MVTERIARRFVTITVELIAMIFPASVNVCHSRIESIRLFCLLNLFCDQAGTGPDPLPHHLL